MDTTARVEGILSALKQCYPEALCALHYAQDYQLMIAVRLSAQCTDARVNLVTPALFAHFDSLDAFADAAPEEIEPYIHSCGFFRAKAKDIVLACRRLREVYDRRIPDQMDQLLTLPGVGRKTANLLLGDLYHQPAYVCDTHCIRISGRLGLTEGKDPEKVEQQLRQVIPPAESGDYCHRIVLHGRAVCTARAPQCGSCRLAPWCKTFTGS